MDHLIEFLIEKKSKRFVALKKSLSALSILCFHLLQPPPFFLGLTGVYLIITLFSIENSLYPKKIKSIPAYAHCRTRVGVAGIPSWF